MAQAWLGETGKAQDRQGKRQGAHQVGFWVGLSIPSTATLQQAPAKGSKSSAVGFSESK